MYAKLFRRTALWSGLLILAGALAGSAAFAGAHVAKEGGTAFETAMGGGTAVETAKGGGPTSQGSAVGGYLSNLRFQVYKYSCPVAHYCTVTTWCNLSEGLTGGGVNTTGWNVFPPTVYASGPIPPRSWKVVVANNEPFVSIGVETVAICATVN